jgi:hypothetical protein
MMKIFNIKLILPLILLALIPQSIFAGPNQGMFNSLFGISHSNNYWGNESDGNFSSTGTASDSLCDSTVNGPTCVKQFNNFTVNSGNTVTTAVSRAGLVIYVAGDAQINGTLTMTARGASGDPAASGVTASGLSFVRKTSAGIASGSSSVVGTGSLLQSVEANQPSISNDGIIFNIPRYGSVGGGVQTSPASGFGGASNGSLQAGGGGGGGAGDSQGSIGYGGPGGQASCFSGGSGGGGGSFSGATGQGGNGGEGGTAANFGGAGGSGASYGGGNFSTGGGAGNPGGTGAFAPNGNTGTGGLLIIFVKGNITVGPSGVISSNGSIGGAAFPNYNGSGGGVISNAGGGGSGGGLILIVYGGSFVNNGLIQNSGGSGGNGSGGNTLATNGGPGGTGSFFSQQVLK